MGVEGGGRSEVGVSKGWKCDGAKGGCGLGILAGGGIVKGRLRRLGGGWGSCGRCESGLGGCGSTGNVWRCEGCGRWGMGTVLMMGCLWKRE
jgi:hypothetical protein